ncbi:hypothetical protein ElP_18490 [Tautonia plasticadhaerens]|uniref:Transcription antitermination protein NusB n=2 Tax=Tautonia plasticadhaerens TaxID=2527974 RepID=A0A518GZE5_9BACT|nr:hypothetical protein ElP_18490 [Tautonia plasticadhaerens]
MPRVAPAAPSPAVRAEPPRPPPGDRPGRPRGREAGDARALHGGTSDRLRLVAEHEGRTEPPDRSVADRPTTDPATRPTMTRRTRGREIALQVLYQLEQNPDIPPEEVRGFIHRRLRDPELRRYADEMISGVRSNQRRLDELIGKVAENWSLERMAAIDRNILRLGAFELLHRPEAPVKVVINEALELAKRYSTAQSSRFVNGILDRLQGPALESRGGTPPADPDAPAEEAPPDSQAEPGPEPDPS